MSRNDFSVEADRLRLIAESGDYHDAEQLLEGVDLNADLAPDLLYYAGVCLGGVGQEQRAIDLLKRAVASGFGRFWCAYHCGLFEAKMGRTAEAAYYFTVCLILDPSRTDVFMHLDPVAPGVDFTSLRAVQGKMSGLCSAREVLRLGTEQIETNLGAAAYYFATAFLLDPEHGEEARSRLLQLAPNISLELLVGLRVDKTSAGLAVELPQASPVDAIRTIIQLNRDPHKIAIDVGANSGYYTKELAANFGRVIAFEPNPNVTEKLQKNVVAANVLIEKQAISDKPGEVTLYLDMRPGLSGVATSMHKLEGLEGLTEDITVPCTTLDAYCEQYQLTPAFIKIDVEGHEPAVIKGAAKTIEHARPVIILEFWETWFNRGYREMFLWLEPMYELRVIQTGELVRSVYLKTEGKLSREAGVVDICALPRTPERGGPTDDAKRAIANSAKPSQRRKPIGADVLRRLAESGDFCGAARLLDGVDLDTDLPADFLYYAGVCLGGIGQEQRAIDLLKRAVASGFGRFWCAYHCGLFEAKNGHTTEAAYYFTACLILDPARTDVFAHLHRVATDLDFASLRAAQARTRDFNSAREALGLGTEKLQIKELGTAAHYFTTALALGGMHGEQARARLLQLAPSICLEVLTGIDMDLLTAEIYAKLTSAESNDLDLERKLALVARVHATYTQHWQNWHASARSLIPAIEAVLERALARGQVDLDTLCLMYDLLFFLYWYRAGEANAMRGFGDRVVVPFAAAIRDGFACEHLPLVAQRQLRREPLRLGYLTQFASTIDGIAVGRFARYLLQGLSCHFPASYRLALYAWMHHNDEFLAPFEGRDILIRRFTADSMTQRIAAVMEAIAADEIDILITDMNTALPTVLFERRVAPIQIFYQVGLPFWPLANIGAVFRIDYYDPTKDGFNPSRCFSMGLGPWDLPALAPEVDHALVASERARFAPGARLVGTYGRLAKITPEFLAIAAELLARHQEIVVILGGTGDGGWIRDFITARNLTGRLELVEGYVDGHVWGHLVEVFLDTFPQEAGFAGREVMAKGRPIVSLRSPWSEKDRIPMLVANDREAYARIVSRLIENRDFYEEACTATRAFVASGPREQEYAAAVHDALSIVIQRVRYESQSAQPLR